MVMSQTSIQVRMSKTQYERIKNNAQIMGFNSLSAYMRFVALDKDFVLRQKVFEIHAHLLGQQPQNKFKKNSATSPAP